MKKAAGSNTMKKAAGSNMKKAAGSNLLILDIVYHFALHEKGSGVKSLDSGYRLPLRRRMYTISTYCFKNATPLSVSGSSELILIHIHHSYSHSYSYFRPCLFKPSSTCTHTLQRSPVLHRSTVKDGRFHAPTLQAAAFPIRNPQWNVTPRRWCHSDESCLPSFHQRRRMYKTSQLLNKESSL